MAFQCHTSYLLKARTDDAEKQPLLGHGSRQRCHVRCDVTQQLKRCSKRHSLWVYAALVATQLCGEHISAAVNQHATEEDPVFSVAPPQGYIMRISRS
jgi:hypothetical protein